MKNTPFLFLFIITAGFRAAASDLVSSAPDRDAKFVADDKMEPNGRLALVLDGTEIWSGSPGWGKAKYTQISWGPHSTKAAIALRETKNSSGILVFDLWEKKKELPLPDIAATIDAMNGHHKGRSFHMIPSGWVDEDHLLISVIGNLVDFLTDGDDELNFAYVFVVELSTQRVLSVTSTSRHNLNSKELADPHGSPESKK